MAPVIYGDPGKSRAMASEVRRVPVGSNEQGRPSDSLPKRTICLKGRRVREGAIVFTSSYRIQDTKLQCLFRKHI